MASASRARQLHRRSSSVTASDPFGQHGGHCDAQSTITIFRPDDKPTPTPPRHRRHGSTERPASPRLSFANQSFSARPSPPPSPTLTSRRPSLPASRPSPDQLVALAHSATAAHPAELAVFTPLPDDILLPFIDRPTEVAALIATPPTSRLLSLLAKTLPASSPDEWSIGDLTAYMTGPNRDTDPDDVWVARIKAAVFAHSELIWERLKAALGVPPDLEQHHGPTMTSVFDSNHDSVFLESPVLDTMSIRSRSSSVASKAASLTDPHAPFESDLCIAPILTPALASPPSDPSHLSGISEEAEDDGAEPPPDPDVYVPTHIHGIRIATRSSSLTSPASAGFCAQLQQQTHHILPPVSPLPPYNPKIGNYRVSPRSSSFGYERTRPRFSSPLSPSASDEGRAKFPTSFAKLPVKNPRFK